LLLQTSALKIVLKYAHSFEQHSTKGEGVTAKSDIKDVRRQEQKEGTFRRGELLERFIAKKLS